MDFPMAKSEERESCAEMELGGELWASNSRVRLLTV